MLESRRLAGIHRQLARPCKFFFERCAENNLFREFRDVHSSTIDIAPSFGKPFTLRWFPINTTLLAPELNDVRVHDDVAAWLLVNPSDSTHRFIDVAGWM